MYIKHFKSLNIYSDFVKSRRLVIGLLIIQLHLYSKMIFGMLKQNSKIIIVKHLKYYDLKILY